RLAIKYSKFKRTMSLLFFKNTVLFFLITMLSCGKFSVSKQESKVVSTPEEIASSQVSINEDNIFVGANQTESYLPLLKGKRVGIVANQTSVIFKNQGSYTHLVDSLLALDIEVKKVFAPEHGFRGKGDAGEHINDAIDSKTGLSI